MAATSLFVALSAVPLASMAQTNYTIYGKIDLDVESQRTATGDTVAMVDNSSRWGIRGSENLGRDWKAFFGIEQGFGADTGVAVTPFRNAYVGLSSATYGHFAMGRLDNTGPTGSPIYSQVSKYLTLVIHNGGTTAFGTKVLNSRNRVSNAVAYMSPVWAGLSVRARMNMAGPDPATPSITSPVKSEADFKQYDVGINYEAGGFGGGIAFSKDTKTGGLLANNFDRKVQLIASYRIDAFKVYGAAGRDRYIATATSRSKVDYWLAGASWESGVHQVMANVMARDVQLDRQARLRKAQAGYRYSISKRTSPYIFVDREDSNSRLSGDHLLAIGIGIVHLF